MAKNIILLSDGTGNSAGKANKTNVWRLYQALDLGSGKQTALYDDGVGTSGLRPLQLLGGAFGWGHARNVRDLYEFLCQHYKNGDQIYVFGFSRGAFTARTLADLITKCGILDPDKKVPHFNLFKLRYEYVQLNTDQGLKTGVRRAYRSYRRSYKALIANLLRWIRDPFLMDIEKPDDFRAKYSLAAPGRIKFVGVWDTVDAVGMPIDELSTMIDKFVTPHRFPDQNLSPFVERACHAIAIDDERQTFSPVLWDECGESEQRLVESGEVARDRIKQAWFPGMHSNVGGGYPDDGLAHVSLRWMVGEAKRGPNGHGLDFNPADLNTIERRSQPLGKMYDSRSGAGIYYRYKPRRIEDLCQDPDNGVNIREPKIHHSVFERVADGTASYAPTDLPACYRLVDQNGTVSDVNPNRYESNNDRTTRAELLDRAQSHIYWRRFLYFMLLFVTLGFVVLPYYLPPVPGRELEGFSKLFGGLFAAASPFLPGFLSYWTDAWTQSPYWFSSLVLLCVGLLWHRRTIAANTHRLAEIAWWHVKKPGGSKPDPPKVGSFEAMATRLRGSKTLKRIHRWNTRTAMPAITLVVGAVVILGVVLRLVAYIPTVGDGVCSKWAFKIGQTGSEVQFDFGDPIEFDTSTPCLDTGLKLYAGEQYTISVKDIKHRSEVGEKKGWLDARFTAGPGGLSDPLSRFHYVFVASMPMRRTLSLPWFALTGEIGLDSGNTFPIPDETVTFRPDDTGTLYLYVNDAINGLGLAIDFQENGNSKKSEDWDAFYKNNEGTAKITVTKGE